MDDHVRLSPLDRQKRRARSLVTPKQARLYGIQQPTTISRDDIDISANKLVHSGNNHHERPSRWEVTSPMLSSPHFDTLQSVKAHWDYDDQHVKRSRSQSLGSALDQEQPMVMTPITSATMVTLREQFFGGFAHQKHQQRKEQHQTDQGNQLKLPIFIQPTDSKHSFPQGPLINCDEDETHGPSQRDFPLVHDTTSSPQLPLESSSTSSSPVEYKNLAVGNPVWISVMYGMINATIVLPVLMSFGSIIYQNEAYQPYINQLIKLTIVSGMVHQLCFSTVSSLPFAVGQVQDAGLIFLSSMATDIVHYCQSRGYDDAVILATATVGLGICTAVLGCGLVVVGKLKLAQYVQRLPTCVIGGYLAYIGWFCGISGLSIMAGVAKLTPTIFWNKIIFILPGLVAGMLIYILVRLVRHMAVLPTCIVILFAIFYVTLWLTKTTIADATQHGWIRPSDDATPSSFAHTWDYFNFDLVVWSALPRLVGTELSMMFVVALSSSLDVAAIELELDQPLNYNHELITVGISNVISGLTGGYTGSYIFSQSIFSLRAGIRSPLAGYVLAGCQLLILILPFPILAYVPNFFYGALLSLIWIDLMYEWLWEVRSKMTNIEYMISLVTFGSMHVLAVEWGILLGVGVYVVCHYVLGSSSLSIQEEVVPDPLKHGNGGDLYLEQENSDTHEESMNLIPHDMNGNSQQYGAT